MSKCLFLSIHRGRVSIERIVDTYTLTHTHSVVLNARQDSQLKRQEKNQLSSPYKISILRNSKPFNKHF